MPSRPHDGTVLVGSSPNAVGGLRGAEQVALAHLAPDRPQLVELQRGLDPLGDAAQPERARQAHDRGRDRGAVGALADALHERAVDLEHLDGQALEVRERRVPGAEVVDREVQPERAQRAERAHRRLGVAHQRRLRDLEPDALGRHVGLVQDARDLVRERRLRELPR